MNLNNIENCITIYNRCLNLITQRGVNNVNNNVQNIINGFLNNMNVNNYANNIYNNDIISRLNILFYRKIADLSIILMNNNPNNFVQEFNNLHNLLIYFEMNLNNNG